jgi:hypothetical protein
MEQANSMLHGRVLHRATINRLSPWLRRRAAPHRLRPHSERSEAPTPSYKYNAWANSRGSQATLANADGRPGASALDGEPSAVWAR